MSERKSLKRWSAKRKQEVALRLLRGETLDAWLHHYDHERTYRAIATGANAPSTPSTSTSKS